MRMTSAYLILDFALTAPRGNPWLHYKPIMPENIEAMKLLLTLGLLERRYDGTYRAVEYWL